MSTGVNRVDAGLWRAGLSDDQVTKINAALEPLKKQYQDSSKELQSQFIEITEEVTNSLSLSKRANL